MKDKLKLLKRVLLGAEAVFLVSLLVSSFICIKNINKVKYQEETVVSYGVRLKDGTIFNNKDNQRILASDVDKITVNIEYFNTTKDIKDEEYEISAYDATYVNSSSKENVLAMLDSRKIIKDQERVVSNVTNVTFELDYQEKVNEINNYMNKLGNEFTSGIVELSLVSEEEKAIVTISVLDEYLSINEVEKIDNTVKEPLIAYILLIIGSLFLLFVCGGFYYIVKKLSLMSEYERNLLAIFKFNKDILVEGEIKEDSKDFVSVDSFKELMKIQYMVEEPIVYSKSEDACKFVIKSATNTYLLILKK